MSESVMATSRTMERNLLVLRYFIEVPPSLFSARVRANVQSNYNTGHEHRKSGFSRKAFGIFHAFSALLLCVFPTISVM